MPPNARPAPKQPPVKPLPPLTLAKKVGTFLVLPGHTAGLIWLAVITITLTFFIALKLPTDPDLFWHLRAGADILQRGVPKIDWYSHTFKDFAWIDHEYAQEIIMRFLEKIGGLRLIAIAYAVLVTAALTAALKWAWPRLSLSWVFVIAPVIAFFARPYLGSRPQMVSYLFVLLLLGLLARFLSHAKDKPSDLAPNCRPLTPKSGHSTKIIWLIPPLFALWANLHASFLVGLVLLLIVLASEGIKSVLPRRLKLGPVTRVNNIFMLAASLALAIVATFANPYGPKIWVEISRTLRDTALHNNIFEWFAPDIHNQNAVAFFVIVILLFIVTALRKNKNDLTTIALASFLMLSGFLAVRNIPLFYLVALPLIALGLRDYWPRLSRLWTKPWLVLIALSLLVPLYVYQKVPLNDLWRFDRDPKIAQARDHYPADAAAFLREHPTYQKLNGFNNYGWGGYLLKNVPWYKTFIDGRMPSWQIGDTKIIGEYFKIDRREEGWPEVLKKYKVGLFIISPDNKIIPELKSKHHFKEVYKDDTAVILIVDN